MELILICLAILVITNGITLYLYFNQRKKNISDSDSLFDLRKKYIQILDTLSLSESNLSKKTDELIATKMIVASLESKIKLYEKTNKELLEQAADDVTVNIKANDKTSVKVANNEKKTRKPYYKKNKTYKKSTGTK